LLKATANAEQLLDAESTTAVLLFFKTKQSVIPAGRQHIAPAIDPFDPFHQKHLSNLPFLMPDHCANSTLQSCRLRRIDADLM